MTLPVVIPNEFANATASIPLSQLDSNFSTLANVVNEINAGTQQLSNANVVTLIVTGNATIGDASSDTVTLNSTLTANTAVIFSAGTSAAPAITTTGDTNTGIFFPAADTIAFATNGVERAKVGNSETIFNDGGADVDFRVEGDTDANLLFVDASTDRVGIGTSSPVANLHISGSTASTKTLLERTGSTGNCQLGFKNTAGERYIGVSGTSFVIGNTSDLLASPQAVIDSSGVLLVGTTASNGGISGANPIAAFINTSATGHGIVVKSSEAGYDCGLIWNNGTTGDNSFFEFGTEATYTPRGSIDYNRGAGLTRYNTTSDATLKNIIGDSDGEKSVEILNSTRIREFAWKDDETQKPQIGVIAQELYKTYKGAVSVGGDYEVTVPAVTEQRLISEAVLDEDGNEIEAAVYETVEVEPERTETKYRPWGVDKTAFTFHLVAGWQAHEKIIKQQADMIAALEARIAALEQA